MDTYKVNKQSLGNTIKKMRGIQGMSQELLAEESGLSIRTIQRIEKGESVPNGDTSRRLSEALKVSPNELMDWTVIEDIDFLKKLNLSALTFIFFPLLGILVPAIMWVSKKDKIKNIDQVSKKLINFQITWSILFILVPFLIIPFLLGVVFFLIEILTGIYLRADFLLNTYIIWFLMYLINVTFIMINTFRIHDENEVKYFPSIKFLKD